MAYDFLVTRFYIAIQKRETLMSGAMSFALTFLAFTVMYEVIKSSSAYTKIGVYATGCAMGTMACILYRKWKARRNGSNSSNT